MALEDIIPPLFSKNTNSDFEGLLRLITSRIKRQNPDLSAAIKRLTGIRPVNISLYEQALTHSSANVMGANGTRIDNERLEYLGDAVLDLVVAEIIFKKYPLKDEGFLTELRARVVNTQFLDNITRKIGLNNHLIADEKSRHMIIQNRNANADLLEALIGAIYLDHGYVGASKFIQSLVKEYVDFEHLLVTESNFKSRLLEWSQKEGAKIQFELVTDADLTRKRRIAIQLLVNGKTVAVGIDATRKEAEQRAAQKFLESLKPSN